MEFPQQGQLFRTLIRRAVPTSTLQPPSIRSSSLRSTTKRLGRLTILTSTSRWNRPSSRIFNSPLPFKMAWCSNVISRLRFGGRPTLKATWLFRLPVKLDPQRPIWTGAGRSCCPPCPAAGAPTRWWPSVWVKLIPWPMCSSAMSGLHWVSPIWDFQNFQAMWTPRRISTTLPRTTTRSAACK